MNDTPTPSNPQDPDDEPQANISIPDFLNALYAGIDDGWLELTFIAPDGIRLYPKVVVSWLPMPLVIGGVHLDAINRGNRKGYSCYFGVTVRDKRYEAQTGTSKHGNAYTYYPRGKQADARYMTAVWLDADGGYEDGLAQIARLPLPPSIIVNSGGGAHAYWLLDKPLLLTEFNRTLAQRTLRGVALAAGSDTKVAEFARVMRLPNTINTKPERGGVFAEVTTFTNTRYSYHEVEMNFAPFAAPAQPRILRNVPASACEIPIWVRRYLEVGAAQGERNNRLYAAACCYRDAGLGLFQAEDELGARALADGLDEGEIERTIQSAYARPKSTSLPSTLALRMAASDRKQR